MVDSNQLHSVHNMIYPSANPFSRSYHDIRIR